MNKQSVIDGLSKISAVMTENKEYLIKLDQQNGDGDLGVSICGSGSLCSRSRGDRSWETHDADRKGVQ